MEYKKITNLPDRTSDNVPRFITKKQVEVYDQSRGSHNIYKQIRFKHQCLDQMIYAITVMYTLLSKELLLLQIQMMHTAKNWLLQIMHLSLAAFQKLIIHLLIM